MLVWDWQNKYDVGRYGICNHDDYAKTARKDEFYTQLTDIEKEMRYYRKHFQGKTVLCNCDDPFESNFLSILR